RRKRARRDNRDRPNRISRAHHSPSCQARHFPSCGSGPATPTGRTVCDILPCSTASTTAGVRGRSDESTAGRQVESFSALQTSVPRGTKTLTLGNVSPILSLVLADAPIRSQFLAITQ